MRHTHHVPLQTTSFQSGILVDLIVRGPFGHSDCLIDRGTNGQAACADCPSIAEFALNRRFINLKLIYARTNSMIVLRFGRVSNKARNMVNLQWKAHQRWA